MPFFFRVDNDYAQPDATRLPWLSGIPWQTVSEGRIWMAFTDAEDFAPVNLNAVDDTVEGETDRAWIFVEGYFDLDQCPGVMRGPGKLAYRVGRILQSDGFDSLERLAGCFIVVLLHPRTGRIWVYRDRVGGKTAFFYHDEKTFLIASAPSLIAGALGTISSNQHWLAHWFGLRWPARPRMNAFAGVREMLPGEFLKLVPNKLSCKRRPFTLPRPVGRGDQKEWVERFGAVFQQSVMACLPRDGDAAIMLSGGMDSAPSACIANAELRARSAKLHAISWTLPGDGRADESRYIRNLSRYLNLELNLFDGSRLAPFDRLDTELVVSDFPTLNLYRDLVLGCYQRVGAIGSEVLLNAAKGDLIYPRANAGLLDLWGRKEWQEFLSLLLVKIKSLGPLGLRYDPGFRHWVGRILAPLRRTAPPVPPWLTKFAIKNLPDERPWPPEVREHWLPAYAVQLMGQPMASGLCQENLFSERYGVERRDPFQNEALVKLMLEMPVAMSFREGMDKWVMREAMRGRMPEELRTKGRTGLLNSFLRMGFERNREKLKRFLLGEQTDWQRWVRRDYVRDVLEGRIESERGLLVIGNCVGYSLWLRRLEEDGISIR